MADISTKEVVLSVKNEGTDISDHMGVFKMIQEMDYVCLGSKDSKNSIFYYKFRQKLTVVTVLLLSKQWKCLLPPPKKERIKIVPMTRDQRKTINRHSHKNREHVLKISEKNLKILKITPPRDNHGAQFWERSANEMLNC